VDRAEPDSQSLRWNSLKLTRVSSIRFYVVSAGVIALALFCVLIYAQFGLARALVPWPFPWPGLVILIAVAVLTERYAIRVSQGLEISASFLPFLLSSALIGPLGGVLTGAIGPVLLFSRKETLRSVWFSSLHAISAGTTGLLYWAALGWLGAAGANSAILVAAVGASAGLVFELVNYMVLAPLMWLRRGMGPLTVWREAFQPFLPFHFFFLAISLGLIYIYRLYVSHASGTVSSVCSTLLIMLCLLPVLGLIYAFREFAHQRELAQRNEALALRNERLFLQAVKSQVTALDFKDNYTARHSAAVARWATDIAAAMALSKHQQNITHLASLVHDVGKIGVPDEVLNFPGKLDGAAWGLIETHCQNGYKILKTIDEFDELAEVILHHHEKYDGSGYPYGLAGEHIPLLSRIICVADSYSAMVSDRPYRKALPVRVAKGELHKCAGRQFDPEIVHVFLNLLSVHDHRYQNGKKVDFDLEFASDRFLRELPHEARDRAPGLVVPSAKS
jgi:HD-GYP domain-containing protein (c-di-GMP phosphodiesterase class II)